LFKNLELDKKLESIQEQLKDLSKEQDLLNEMTDDKNSSSEELAKKQEEINKKFEEIQKDIQDAKDKNNELETPRDLDFNDELEKDTKEELEQSKENLDNNKKKKSQENQKNASDMMQQMADDIKAMMDQQESQQQGEDIDSLRFLLENIINLSFQQEDLMNSYSQTQTTDPNYLVLNREQLSLKKSTKIVEDSLVALSKRVYQLSSFITQELSNLNYNLDKSMVYAEERRTNQLQQHQQYSVTSYNELALMLSEVLDQLQQQQQSQQQGSGSCSKPGGMGQGKGSMSMQEMKEKMQKQINNMKNGESPGGKQGEKPGEGEGQGKGEKPSSIPGLSPEQVAKMAFEQGQMKQALQKMREDLNKDGSGNGNQLNDLIKEIEELEKDLLNQNFTNIYKRQQEIYVKLLESEKALQERGYSEERESKEGKNSEEGNLNKITEYNRKKQAEIELLKSVPVGLRLYYKNIVNDYFNSVNN